MAFALREPPHAYTPRSCLSSTSAKLSAYETSSRSYSDTSRGWRFCVLVLWPCVTPSCRIGAVSRDTDETPNVTPFGAKLRTVSFEESLLLKSTAPSANVKVSFVADAAPHGAVLTYR